MSRYKNSVIPIRIEAGTRSGTASMTVEKGFIKRAVISKGTVDNPGMVRASIEDFNGNKIAETQALEMFKVRNVEYSLDGVPLNVNGGSQITFKILATENFNTALVADLILIYEEENC